MPAGVREALRFCAMERAGMSEEEAQLYISKMERERRLIEECWS
jgi:sulfite reductase alpha subunit-like flavoprotein